MNPSDQHMQTSQDTDRAHVANKHCEIGWAQALSFASTEFINPFLSMIGGIESIAFRFSALMLAGWQARELA